MNGDAMATAPAATAKERQIIYSLQILRGIAAFLVLMRHSAKFSVTKNSWDAFGMGQAGVDIFFVISGVVIYLTGRNLEWHVFFRRRIARIVPLYWLMTSAAVIVAVLPGLLGATGFTSHGGFSLYNAVMSYLFIPAPDENGDFYPQIVAGWTLNFEMYFYTLCALALLFAPRRLFPHVVTGLVLIGIGIGATLFWGHGAKAPVAPMVLLLPIALEFVAGLWIARIWLTGRRTSSLVNALLLAAAVAWLALSPVAAPYSVWRPLAWGVPAAMIIWAMMASEERFAFKHWRPALLLGDSSYALYLTHPMLLAFSAAVLRKLHIALPMGIKFCFAIALCVAVGIIVHKLVELPLVKVASRLLGLSGRPVAHASLQSAEGAAT